MGGVLRVLILEISTLSMEGTMHKFSWYCLYCLFLIIPGQTSYSLELQTQIIQVEGSTANLQVPKGMRLEFVAKLNGPRFISRGPDDEFIIGSLGSSLYRVAYPYTSAEVLVSLSGFLHSAVYRQGALYAAETTAVWSASYQGVSTQLAAQDFEKVVTLPSTTGGHSSRTVITGPDGRLYVGIGISGNCSDEYLDMSYPFERRRGGVYRINNNSTLEPYSSGLRNPIGLAFHPQTQILYATNAGPDNLGYDNPPEILARVTEGSFHGMPWFHYYGGSFQDGQCAQSQSPRPVSEAIPPVAFFAPRSTPEGIAFLSGEGTAGRFAGNAAVAIHGSWAIKPGSGPESRRPPKLALVVFENNVPVRVEDMITGFQRSDGSRFARPCGVAVGADGNIYFTSDKGDVTGLFRLVLEKTSIKTTATSILMLLLGGSTGE